MIRFLCRFIGLWLIAGALVALVVDATKSIAASRLEITSLGEGWGGVAPASLAALEAFVHDTIETATGAWIWSPIAEGVLALPTWIVLGALGFLLTWAGQRRRRDLAFA